MLKFFSRLERTRGVVIISFAVLVVLGLVVAGYNRGGGNAAITNPFKSNEALAKVNGDEVTVADYSLLKKKIENQYSQFGGQISLAQLGMTPERILDQAINSRIAVQEARRLGLSASDDEVRDLIQKQFSDPTTGVFDVKNYKEYGTRNYRNVPLYQQIVLRVADPKLDQDVLTKASQIVARIRKDDLTASEEDFAEAARGNSEDPLTAKAGGWLPAPVKRIPNKKPGGTPGNVNDLL